LGGNPRYAGNARYFPGGLEKVLRSASGDLRLGRALGDVVVVSYDVKHAQPLLFKSTETAQTADGGPPMWQVAYATAAGPTFFPPSSFPIRARIDCVWMGVAANNPAMIGFIEALRSGADPSTIRVVSLGTGTVASTPAAEVTYKKVMSMDWFHLASRLVGMIFDGTSAPKT
jgi:patatin-like phospholipase/acyl hydrolase